MVEIFFLLFDGQKFDLLIIKNNIKQKLFFFAEKLLAECLWLQKLH